MAPFFYCSAPRNETSHGFRHSIMPAPLTARVGVIVGNGFTLACIADFGLFLGEMPDPPDVREAVRLANRPLDWRVTFADQPGLTFRTALPAFHMAADRLRAKRPEAHHFEILRELAGPIAKDDLAVDVETRHFLSFVYRQLSIALWTRPLEQWVWFQWLKAHAPALFTAVSFNYDCLLEEVLARIGRSFTRHHTRVGWDIVRLFKPHGSCDFDLPITRAAYQDFPIRFHAYLSNVYTMNPAEQSPIAEMPLRCWDRAPLEPLIVLPYEENPYSAFAWCKPGYDIYRNRAQHLTHCVFLGLSYHEADRKEIDHFLYCTPKQCTIIVANINPDEQFCEVVRRSGRELFVWRDGPQRLPLSDI